MAIVFVFSLNLTLTGEMLMESERNEAVPRCVDASGSRLTTKLYDR